MALFGGGLNRLADATKRYAAGGSPVIIYDEPKNTAELLPDAPLLPTPIDPSVYVTPRPGSTTTWVPSVDATKGTGTSSTTPTGTNDMSYRSAFTPTIGGSYSPTMPSGGGGFDVGGFFGDVARDAAGRLLDRYLPSGSEPAQGNAPVPGNFGPTANTGSGCEPPSFMLAGKCVDATAALPGGKPFISSPTQYGNAVYGRYGLALQPGMKTVTKAVCPRGMVLGDDGLCYESLPKSKRKWNPGAKPLLTGGEMNAIRRAERAAKRLSSTKKKLKATTKALSKAC